MYKDFQVSFLNLKLIYSMLLFKRIIIKNISRYYINVLGTIVESANSHYDHNKIEVLKGEHWSFVKAGKNNKAIEVKEKERISDNCYIGAYYFKTASLYKELYSEFYKKDDNLVNGEKYIAPLYNLLIKTKGDVYIGTIDNSKVHVLGTPKELEEFRNQCHQWIY